MDAAVDNASLQRLYSMPFTPATRRGIVEGWEGDDARKSAQRVIAAVRSITSLDHHRITDADTRWLFHQSRFVGTRYVWQSDNPAKAWTDVQEMGGHFARYQLADETNLRVQLREWLRAIHCSPWGGKTGRTDHRVLCALVSMAWLHGDLTFTVGDRTLAQHAWVDREALAGEKGKAGSVSRLAARGFVTRTTNQQSEQFGTTYQLPSDLLDKLQYHRGAARSLALATRPYTDSLQYLRGLKVINESVYGRVSGAPGDKTGLPMDSWREWLPADWQAPVHADWRLIHPAFYPVKEPHQSLDYQLYAVLSNTPRSTADLAKITGKGQSTIRENLRVLADAGLAGTLADGRWKASGDARSLHLAANSRKVWTPIARRIAHDAYQTAFHRTRPDREAVVSNTLRALATTPDDETADSAPSESVPARISEAQWVQAALDRFKARVEQENASREARLERKARDDAFQERQRELRRQEREAEEERRRAATSEEIDDILSDFL